MKRFMGFSIIAIFTVLLMLAPSASDAILIDHFDTPQSLLISSPGSVSSSVTGPGILGGERDMTLNHVSGIASVAIDANGSGFSLLTQSGDATVQATSQIDWDGVDGSTALDPTGLGGVDLTDSGASNSIGIDVVFDDLPANIQMVVYTDSGNFSYAALPLPGGIFGSTLFNIPFASFIPLVGSADFSNVGAVSMYIDATIAPGTDIQIHFVDTEVPGVPEPTTMILMGLGLIGIYGASRKRK